MGTPSKAVKDFMAEYGIASDEIWEVHGSTWVVKHKALERVAAEQNIVWDRPAILECNSADGVAALCVFGKLGERMEWSIGEALVAREGRIGGNYKVTGKQAGYVYAMAEKRAKDRVILKLLSGAVGLYSEAEADEFAEQPPAKAKPASKKDARADYEAIQKEIWAFGDVPSLNAWGAANAERIQNQPEDWQQIIRTTFAEHKASIQQRDGAGQQRMAS